MITRFAPSPTGKLHIGGARTALFSYMYAKRNGGQFRLRIEDTDKERSTSEFVTSIMDGLNILGIVHDDEVIYQSDRESRHVEVAKELIARGAAYYCYNTAEDNDIERANAAAENRAFRSMWRDMTGCTMQPPTVRLRITKGVTITDVIKGEISFDEKHIDDLIILRSDGSPTYNLAVVVDDYDMGVTDIIRGDDHVSNTAKQVSIYDAMGWSRPNYAHVPLIYGEDGKKLSKRHGAQDVQHYIDLGYLPEAIVNYLCKLGWAHGNDEFFDLPTAIEWFDVRDVKSSPARLDMKKLKSINSYWMKLADNSRLAKIIGCETTADLRAIEVLKHKVSTLIELKDEMAFIKKVHDSDFVLASDLVNPFALFRLRALGVKEWTPEIIHDFILEFSKTEEIPMKVLGTPLRQMLTGLKTAPELHNIMYILDKAEVSERIRIALVKAQAE